MNQMTDLVSRRKAAEMLNVCPRTIARYEKQSRLLALKLTCRTTRYRRCDVEKFVDNAASKLGAV